MQINEYSWKIPERRGVKDCLNLFQQIINFGEYRRPYEATNAKIKFSENPKPLQWVGGVHCLGQSPKKPAFTPLP